jgi:hypothetical protein
MAESRILEIKGDQKGFQRVNFPPPPLSRSGGGDNAEHKPLKCFETKTGGGICMQ